AGQMPFDGKALDIRGQGIGGPKGHGPAVPGQLVAGKNRRVLEYPIAHHELAGSAEGWAGEGREPRQSQVTEAQFAVELEADGRVAAQVLDIADQGAVVLLPEVGP